MRGGEERVDEKGWGHEEGRIIGELIQRETDRGRWKEVVVSRGCEIRAGIK